ncbi:uncharacterized protein LOC110617833, partial [Manihot esculenta]|uniref:uncharacterized protein LOC110617833 n=1 Tax=Manihot esculenta TaxID=3983 RepID=UPI001CC3E16E
MAVQDTLLYDPEIERTTKSLRKQTNLRNQASKASSSATATSRVTATQSATKPSDRTDIAPAAEFTAPADSPTAAFEPEIEFQVSSENYTMAEPPVAYEEVEAEAENVPIRAPQPWERTLRELAIPAEDQAPLCIAYPQLTAPFELKTGLIHLLPKFRGLKNEDHHKHLKEFHIVCSTMRPEGISEDHVKLRAFPFSLDDYAKDWLFYLPPGSITSWAGMVRAFLSKFFPTSKAIGIRREISDIRQKHSEGLYEYWERFKRLCTSYPQHDISEKSLIEYFYGGLLPAERKFIDAACGGSIQDKTPQEMRNLISTMAEFSSQQTKVDQQSVEKFKVPPPFPRRFARSQKEKEEKEILETFRKVEINIPLLDAVKQIPRYAKFLKELCTNRRKLTEREKVSVGECVSAVIQRKLPTKCKDRGMFAVSCKIGNVGIKKAMCDLGASINVMPLSIFNLLNAGTLKGTSIVIQLVDRSVVYPKGVLEDVLVQVDQLVFPADFYVIDMEEDKSNTTSDILLGRPFLSIARTKINVHDGTLTMEFEGKVIKFNIYDAMKFSNDVSPVYGLDII